VHELIRERVLEPLGHEPHAAAITDEVRADEARLQPRCTTIGRPPRPSPRRGPWIVLQHGRRLDRLRRDRHECVHAVAAETAVRVCSRGRLPEAHRRSHRRRIRRVPATATPERVRSASDAPSFRRDARFHGAHDGRHGIGAGCTMLVNGSGEREPIVSIRARCGAGRARRRGAPFRDAAADSAETRMRRRSPGRTRGANVGSSSSPREPGCGWSRTSGA